MKMEVMVTSQNIANFMKDEETLGQHKKLSRIEHYEKIIKRLQKYSETRMGHPYTGPARGYFTDTRWVVDSTADCKLIDNTVLGIIPGSIADTYINNSGSPYTKSKLIQRDVKDIEIDLLNILASFFNYPAEVMRGYVTSGATEASLSCLWWLRENLSKYREDVVYLFASDHSHYSISKISNILRLKMVTISSSQDGAIDIYALEKSVKELVLKKPNCNIIFSLNIGTTEFGGIDDIPTISEKIKNLKRTYPFDYRIHADAAILGLTIPVLELFGKKSIFEFVDTLIFSGHKLLGTLSISGVALARISTWEQAFNHHNLSVNYILGIEDSTALGSRSGYPVIEFHHALCSLNIDTDSSKLKKLITTCLENAEYLAEKLKKIVGDAAVTYNKNQFTVTFPCPSINEDILLFLQRYGLMKVRGERLGICVLAHVGRTLINQFLMEYKSYV